MPENNALPWAKLWFEPQSERSMMPPFVVGVLTKETPGHYVLSSALEEVENEDTGIYEIKPSPNLRFYNKTYVYCLEMLSEPPQIAGFGEPYNGEGGLG